MFFLNGCDGGSQRAFDYRNFTITGGFATHDFNGDAISDVLWRAIMPAMSACGL